MAAASGVIERSYTSATYGETVILRHRDGGATLYAHLQARNVQQGAEVSTGEIIGTANSTGHSSGDHLHFEYVPNGAIIQSPNRIDPDACVGATVDGSIRVSDNGTLADDAFRVALDGLVVGETQVGQANNFALNNLVPGRHTLSVTAIVAPDNVGTLLIELSSGIVFEDGTTQKSLILAQGATASFIIIVPQPR